MSDNNTLKLHEHERWCKVEELKQFLESAKPYKPPILVCCKNCKRFYDTEKSCEFKARVKQANLENVFLCNRFELKELEK